MKPLNILFIQVDQLVAKTLKAYGNTVCHTPHLDQLAEQSAVFEQAYCNFPLCAPSRFSMATGQLCSQIGAFDNAAEMPASVPTYAHYLRHLGYQTAVSGKLHFIGPDQYHGFEKRLTAELYPADFSWVPNWEYEGKRDTNDSRAVTIAGVCERSIQLEYDEEVAFKAIQHLYTLPRFNDQRPFFLQVSFTHPHEPYLCQQEYWDLYQEGVPAPDVAALSEQEHDAHSIRLLKDFNMLGRSFDPEAVQTARRAYYGSISYIDNKVGQLLRALKAIGADQNTAIIFTSDHGDFLGERGLWFKKHFFEAAMRIPLMIAAPGIKPQRVKELVSLVDLLPTFNSLATEGAWENTLEPLAGGDLLSFLDQGEELPSRTVFAEYLAETTLAPIFMIRQGDHKYMSSEKDPKLLFNLADDPNELNNLAQQPEEQDRVQQFEQQVQKKWDSKELTERIIQSQKQRILIRAAQKNGQPVSWNHGELAGEDVPWYRGKQGYNAWAFDYLKVE